MGERGGGSNEENSLKKSAIKFIIIIIMVAIVVIIIHIANFRSKIFFFWTAGGLPFKKLLVVPSEIREGELKRDPLIIF